jgi:hypothetical protein
MKSRVIIIVSLLISGVLFYLVFTQGLMFINSYLGLYNVNTFRFRLGEAVFILFVFLLLFLFPIIYGYRLLAKFGKLKKAPLTSGKKGIITAVTVACGALGALIIVLLHTGFFRVLSDFLYFCGITGTGVTLGMLGLEIVLAMLVLLPALFLLLYLRKAKRRMK